MAESRGEITSQGPKDRPPYIVTVDDGLTSSTARYFIYFGLGLAENAKLKAAQARGETSDAGSLELPEGLSKALKAGSEEFAKARIKMASFADVIASLNQAGKDFKELQEALQVLQDQFSGIDISGDSNPSLKTLLLNTKDNAILYEVRKLEEASAKTRRELTDAVEKLNLLTPKMEATGDKSLVAKNNKGVTDSLLGPLSVVTPAVPKKIKSEVYNEVQVPIKEVQGQVEKLTGKINSQIETTKALAPENVRRDLAAKIKRVEPTPAEKPPTPE